MKLAAAIRRLTPVTGIPRAILVTDPVRLPDPRPVLPFLPPGAVVLLRLYDGDDRRDLAEKVAVACRRHRLRLVVAADWRLAAAIRADGVHLPEWMARRGVLAAVRGWVRRRGGLLIAACHSPMALARARCRGVDAAILSPVFPTHSHPAAAGIGAVRWRGWARRAGLPVIALGGITGSSALRLGPVGVAGYGAISGWITDGACAPPSPDSCRSAGGSGFPASGSAE
ncbi:Thiamine monophosphate synthase (modular protein) [Magnetospirillum sp. LM-5]|uniref:thiamine phosphate synthase n=1 Tax=Magnetospirillum sp. LM-5 TaxID=2681466 RepID=UPI00137D87E8|nr:thiamine phosphate synthase [Magnetospirillum sp. LM-5]CAA7622722.1 Thiamine monophosphate synthase (modular protein) [Magnetospirillum sp. LM-5]